TTFRRTNKLFEFNRKMFYRNLEEEKAEIDDTINVEETKAFWKQVWSNGDSERDEYRELIDLLEPVELQTDLSREKIKEIVDQQIKYLSNWKTTGPDHVYNFFIKKLYVIQE